MVKKISAILLALVLCLSVMVFPASAAAELNGTQVAYALEWDKEYYEAGDTATLYLYLAVQDDIPLEYGLITIGLNSAFISPDDNVPAECVTASDVCASYYKALDESNTAQSTSTYQTRIEGQNTAEENATYDWYLRIALNKNASGDHPNCSNNKDGLYGSEIDPTVPFITYTFTVADGVVDGSVIPAAITSGSAKCSPAQLQFKYYNSPGTGTGKGTIAAAQLDVSAAVAEATVGTPSIISALNPQIRFNGLETNGAGSANFDVRTRATVSKADFAEVLGVSEAELEATAKASTDLRVGFVYMATSNGEFNIETAKAAAQNPAAAAKNYFVKDVTYVQRSGDNYVWTCLLTYEDGMYSNGVSALPYIICGEEVHFLDAVTPVTFSTLYGTYYSQYAEKQAS